MSKNDEQPTPQQRAQRLIDHKLHMTLATVGSSVIPWVSPVFYVPDDRYDLYWTSWKDAQHSQNIRNNPAVAIVVYHADADDPVDAVYMAARAVELNDQEEVTLGIEIMERRNPEQPEWWRIKSISDVTGDGPWRIYRATPETIDVRRQICERGKRIVTRQAADFRTVQ